MIYIYGASDDLVEIEGDIREEFSYPYDPEKYYVAFSNGFVASIDYNEDGEWAIRMKVVPLGHDSDYTIHPAGSELAKKYTANDYSDVLVIDRDTTWVIGGREFVK